MFEIKEGMIAEVLAHEGIDMVTVSFAYPVLSGGNQCAAKRINAFYSHAARTLLKKARGTLLPSAIEEYRYSTENGYPFRPYEAVMKFSVTMNSDDILSLYRDVYVYTGGAHGNTERFGDTWQANSGWPVELKCFFPRGTNYRRLLTGNAIEIANRQTAEGTAQYFDDYPKLIRKYFRASRYYITQEGVAIFYGQYEIAPYSEGIPVFIYTQAKESDPAASE